MNRSKYSHNGTICWNCKNACGGCSWSKEFKPVEGWDATYSPVMYARGYDYKREFKESYVVHECPEFERG